MRIGFLLVPLLGVLALLPSPREAGACAPAPPRNVVVDIASESAIIIWDEKTQTEHFIRKAAFQAKPASGTETPITDFGFLVPTPTQPELSEVDDQAFGQLAELTKPKTVTQQRPKSGGCMLTCGGMAPGSKYDLARSVQVLEQKSVAGYDAAVLKASEADSLTKWLTDHGYETRPALTAWLEPLIQKKWIITAFKISKDPKPTGSAILSPAVRLSFKTEKPFYPYREPVETREQNGNRLLRVFFIGEQRVTGTVGSEGAWSGKPVWANGINSEARATLAAHLKLPVWDDRSTLWLTEFEDRASPRQGTDEVYFAPAQDQSVLERPVNIVYIEARRQASPLPMGIVATLLLGLGLVLTRRSR